MIKFRKKLFRKNKQSNISVVMCSSCNDVIDLTDKMNNWIVLDKHYCGGCYSKLTIDNIKSKYV